MPHLNTTIVINNVSYLLSEELGRGMYGKVYLATASDQTPIAVKIFEFNQDRFDILKLKSKLDLEVAYQHALLPLLQEIDEITVIPVSEHTSLQVARLTALKEKIAMGDTYFPARLEKMYKEILSAHVATIKQSVEYEHTMLAYVEHGLGPIFKLPSEPAPIYYIAMRLAPGKNITDILLNEFLSLKHRLNISKLLGESLAKLADQSLVMRDLHLNNIMYERPQTSSRDDYGNLTIIDYGDALILENGFGESDAMGSEPCMAPEILQALDATHPLQKVSYNDKTTVYAYGAMLAKLFDLGILSDTNAIKEEAVKNKKTVFFKKIILHETSSGFLKIKNPLICGRMLALIKEMMADNANDRPSLIEVNKQLHQIIAAYLLSARSASSMLRSPSLRGAEDAIEEIHSSRKRKKPHQTDTPPTQLAYLQFGHFRSNSSASSMKMSFPEADAAKDEWAASPSEKRRSTASQH
jgi:serine/threonine protein kinase